MAQHKAATDVTIAPIGERSALAVFFERYWKGFAIAFVLLSAAILYRASQTEAAREVADKGWDELRAKVEFTSSQFGQPQANFLATPEELVALAEKYSGQAAGPWSLALAATAFAKQDKFAEAADTAARLKREYPGHPLTTWDVLKDGEQSLAAAALLEERTRAMAEWKSSNGHLFENPPLPAGSPRVRLETSAGPIELGLYADRAPKHVENFLKLVDEGYYTGTRFHRVVRDFMIQGGDPNSKELDPGSWGMGGPGYKIDAEPSDLIHFRGALAAAKMGGEVQSSGSQFYITTGSPHHLDGLHTVFGTVISGWPAIEAIETAELVTGTERPREPATILSASRL